MQPKITLTDVIDMHVHTAPDTCQRTYNDLELTATAVHTLEQNERHIAFLRPRVRQCAFFNLPFQDTFSNHDDSG